MTVQGWIVFAIGILFILVGGGLMVYSSLSRRQTAKASIDQGILNTILNFVLKVLEIIVKLIPQNIVSQVGFILIIVGIALVVLPFLIPGL